MEPAFVGTSRFQVLRRLGAGGMGVVFEAYDREREAHVALKTLRLRSPTALLRFKNEFRALQDLVHPNLVGLGELFEAHGEWFFTMELVKGQDLLSYLRPGGHAAGHADTDGGAGVIAAAPTLPGQGAAAFDAARARATLVQLAAGLQVLHAAGKIHRDIKPHNILVTADGRVVLLDFGLVVDAAHKAESDVVGTAFYMAPEQAASQRLGPEADWYGVGVILYEAITGRLPFAGALLEVMLAKQRAAPPPPRTLVPDVPADLDELCAALLHPQPAQRPSGREVLRRLREAGAAVDAALLTGPPSVSQTPPFVGRRPELARLHGAYARVCAGETVVVVVRGESGVGKTALVRHFLEELDGEQPRLVLAGRCYEHETVPYKACDELVDGLSRHLAALPATEAAALAPRYGTLLAQVFPVLLRVEALTARTSRTALERLPLQEARLPTATLDPQELRARVFGAFRELLGRLAARAAVVLVIDDLQWADADSFALLAEVLRAPDAPPLLLCATVRDTTQLDIAASLRAPVEDLGLARLPHEDAITLATMLLTRASGGSAPEAAALAGEAGGHPLFIDELVRHGLASGRSAGPLHLDDVVWGRVEALEEPVRRLLTLMAVAGGPIAQETLAAAAALDFGTVMRHVGLARTARLCRTAGARRADTVEPYHDRVREAVLARLAPEARAGCHERLARALEAAGRADPEALATHWRGAGEHGRAARYAVLGAARASEALAFDRAAQLYRLALELGAENDRALRVALGDALANAGRGGEAAAAYLTAVAHAPAAEALECRRRAAEELLRSGRIDEGLAAVHDVLSAVGMRLPRTTAGALASLLFRRLLLRLRGFRFRRRDASQVSAEELTRVDICWSVAAGLAVADPLRGADFQTRNLLLALRCGEPYRIARALAMEAAFVATAGGKARHRSARLVAEATRRAHEVEHPHPLGLATGMAGLALYLEGRWRPALELCSRAEAIFRDQCVGVAWELATVQLFAIEALCYLGDLVELERRVPLRLREVIERGDLYAAAHLRAGYLNVVWLMRDDPAGARREADEALRDWSRQGFFAQHFYHLFAHQQIDLYTGDGRAAYRRISEIWPRMARSLFLRIQLPRIMAVQLRGRAALAAASQEEGAARAPLLTAARRDARRLERERMPWASGYAALLRAGAAALAAHTADALAELARAEVAFASADMALYACVVRRARGLLLCADEGRAIVAAEEAWLTARGVRRPDRFAAMHAPGFTDGSRP